MLSFQRHYAITIIRLKETLFLFETIPSLQIIALVCTSKFCQPLCEVKIPIHVKKNEVNIVNINQQGKVHIVNEQSTTLFLEGAIDSGAVRNS